MKKKVLFAAMALVALASCSDETFVGDVTSPQDNSPSETNAIVFSSASKGITRADFEGAEAAQKLGNKFVVFGYKGETTGTPGSTVFDNYLVKYTENTANTTESNSKNWEYVLQNVSNDQTYEYVPIPHATSHGITQQTIKYWDYSQTQYDFFAWSTGSKTAIYTGTTPAEGQVLVSEMAATKATNSDDPKTGLKNAYTFTGKAADLAECYISDLVTVNKAGTAGIGEVTGYNQPVKLKFRQLGTKVRIGIYETVPGYSVKNVKFYRAAAAALPTTNEENAYLFTTAANEIYTEGTYEVFFPTVDKPEDADNNQAHIKFAPKANTDQKTTVEWGGLNYTIRESGESSADAIYLGRTSNTASFANKEKAAQNYYEVFLPNQSGTNLNLRVNYTLESIDGSKETIEVRGATAQVPSIYTQWKPGYAYTYLFKISDKSNGYTGVYDPTNPDGNTFEANPAGLYPITFDAVVVNADEDATQETITLVSTPSITSYQKGSTVVDANEYTANGNDIFVTVNDGTGTITCTAVANGTKLTAGNVYYTSTAGAGAFIATGNETADGTNYFVFNSVNNTILGTGTLQTLTGKADLYIIDNGMTEAEVIDALSYYYTKANDVATYTEVATPPTADNFSKAVYYTQSGAGTEESPYTYTEATSFVENTTYFTQTSVTSGTTKGRSGKTLNGAAFALVNKVEFGADGNVITVGADQALRFNPATGTYAFVYTQKEATSTPDKFQAKTFADGVSVNDYYRYALKAAGAGDVQANTFYFTVVDNTATPLVPKERITPFLGQTVNNLYLDDQGNTIASGYAKTSTNYYYTVNGQSYLKAENINYIEKNQLPSGLYEFKNNAYVPTNDQTLGWEAYNKAAGDPLEGFYTYDNSTHEYTLCTATAATAETAGYYYKPVTGKAYYKNTAASGDPVYRLCVFLPQQTTDLYVIDEGADKVACGNTESAVNGMTYFDKYTKDNAVRYVKVIKVQ